MRLKSRIEKLETRLLVDAVRLTLKDGSVGITTTPELLDTFVGMLREARVTAGPWPLSAADFDSFPLVSLIQDSVGSENGLVNLIKLMLAGPATTPADLLPPTADGYR